MRYQRPPVAEPLDPLVLSGGERLEGEIKYYDYGVVSVIYQLTFFRRLGKPRLARQPLGLGRGFCRAR